MVLYQLLGEIKVFTIFIHIVKEKKEKEKKGKKNNIHIIAGFEPTPFLSTAQRSTDCATATHYQ